MSCNWTFSGTQEPTLEIKHTCGDVKVMINDVEYRPVKPVPKLYTFAEAYAMMKAGKWMKPATKAKYVECYKIMPNGNVCYLKHDGCTGYYNPDAAAFSAETVADQWQEAMQLKE